MKHLLTAATVLLATTAHADNFNVASKVTAVTAYSQAGVTTRRATLDIPAGTHTVTLRSGAFQNAEYFFEAIFPADADVQLVSTQINHDALEPNRPEKSDVYKTREAALIAAQALLDAFDEKVNTDRGVVASAELRMKFLQSLAQGNVGAFPKDGAINSTQLDAVVGSLGAQMQTAQDDMNAANIRLSAAQKERIDLQHARDDAQQALQVVTPQPQNAAEVILTLKTASGFKGPLQIRTMGQMNWRPQYKLLLSQSDNQGVLRIERKVMLSQETGEDWTDVEVTLSTAALGQRQSASTAYSDIKRLEKPVQAYSKNARQSGMLKGTADAGAWGAEEVMEDAPSAAPSSMAVQKGQTIEYRLTNPVSLRSGRSGGGLFELDAMETSVDLFAQAHAARDDRAFLYAEFENTTGGSILKGPATIYRDGAFVGEGKFPEIVNGDSTDLALGPIDGLLLDRRTVSREDGDRGIISSSNARELRYETIIESYLNYAIDLRLFDVIPTSESEDLVIREFLQPKPTQRDVDGKRGVLRWDVTVKPGSTKTLKTGYDMVWPADQQLR